MDPLLAGAAGSHAASPAGSLDAGAQFGGQTNEQMFQQYRGAIPVQSGSYSLVKEDDPDHKKPVKRFQVHAKVFNLEDENPESKHGIVAYQKALQDVYDAAAGAELIVCDIRAPERGIPNWSAFVQWRTAMILPANVQGTNQHIPTR